MSCVEFDHLFPCSFCQKRCEKYLPVRSERMNSHVMCKKENSSAQINTSGKSHVQAVQQKVEGRLNHGRELL